MQFRTELLVIFYIYLFSDAILINFRSRKDTKRKKEKNPRYAADMAKRPEKTRYEI